MNIIDWRDLPRADWSIGARSAPPRFITLHYNGPAIPQPLALAHWRDHLTFIADFHMGPYLKADGFQYHYAVLPAGEIVQTRDEQAQLWHCGNVTGNAESIAVHLPLGGSQRPSQAQWRACEGLLDQLRAKHGITVDRVFGHRQWPRRNGMASIANGHMPKQSECPGDVIMAMLAEWRASLDARVYRVKYRANVREAPRVSAPIAWSGACILMPGTLVEGATPVMGEPFKGNPHWLHWPGGGFIHSSAIEAHEENR